ncbi:uncharacterized protein DNG_09541 [Cephalotrichum gorgonifer]|uniref:Uncharacterized protein n=1 Tax=Cephalotrichum gorgonifer TaxID=2041049 RepID=A0AAE8N621_9PEZI|nr:uncharacterized protein DNG_09541 [Cephalotrichum gorgonifer]
MIVAAIYLALEGYKMNTLPTENKSPPFGDSSTYIMAMSVIAAIFSIFPLLVLYLLLSRRDRDQGQPTNYRMWLRRAALLLIWVLLVIEMFLRPGLNSDYESTHDKDVQGKEKSTGPMETELVR